MIYKKEIYSVLIIFVLSVCCLSCNTQQKPAKVDDSITINQEIQSHKGYPILIGKIDRIGLEGGTYQDWFTEGYNSYQPDQTTLDSIGAKLQNTAVQVFMGSWCEDSQREVPHFYKILDAISFDETKLEVIALDHHPDRHKQSPGKEEAGKQIELVPTFIFYKGETEIGRIVESPKTTLEKDIATILKNASF